MEAQPINMQVGISGVFEFRDAEGNLVKTVEVNTVVPLNAATAAAGVAVAVGEPPEVAPYSWSGESDYDDDDDCCDN